MAVEAAAADSAALLPLPTRGEASSIPHCALLRTRWIETAALLPRAACPGWILRIDQSVLSQRLFLVATAQCCIRGLEHNWRLASGLLYGSRHCRRTPVHGSRLRLEGRRETDHDHSCTEAEGEHDSLILSHIDLLFHVDNDTQRGTAPRWSELSGTGSHVRKALSPGPSSRLIPQPKAEQCRAISNGTRPAESTLYFIGFCAAEPLESANRRFE